MRGPYMNWACRFGWFSPGWICERCRIRTEDKRLLMLRFPLTWLSLKAEVRLGEGFDLAVNEGRGEARGGLCCYYVRVEKGKGSL